MVWHELVLPGVQTMTDTNSVLTLLPEGPPSTTTLATLFGAAGGGGCVGMVPAAVPPPPPPQAAANMTTADKSAHRSARMPATSASLRCSPRSPPLSPGRPSRTVRPCDRLPAQSSRLVELAHAVDRQISIGVRTGRNRSIGPAPDEDRDASAPARPRQILCRLSPRTRASQCPRATESHGRDSPADPART